jgi:hypothetical protein
MDPAGGPGTPSYDDADQMFHRALDTIDLERDDVRRREALRVVLDRARERDAMTLWHLIPRVPIVDRGRVVDALALGVAMPAVVTRDAVMRLDRAALDQWWNALGLLDVNWWRTWKGAVPLPHAEQTPTAACPVTPTVRETPPPDPNASPFGTGPWNANADRTIWVWNASFPTWRQGLNRKVMWIRPAGTTLQVSGERLDGPSSQLTSRIPLGYPTGFQVSSITFPSAGCWKVKATADHVLEFVTKVDPQ